MFVIKAHQFAVFEAIAAKELHDDVYRYLHSRKPAAFHRFPETQRHTIVDHMIRRAKSHGLRETASVMLYCDLMQSVAPNFDRHPEIAAALCWGARTPDGRMEELVSRTPPRVWEEASAQREELYLYTSPEVDDASLAERTAAALPLILWQEVTVKLAPTLAVQAEQHAVRLGFEGFVDAPLVVAAWECLYGPAYSNQTLYPWLRDVFKKGRPPMMQLELLRLRIALDHGRRV